MTAEETPESLIFQGARFGRYEVVRRIAIGGMAEIFLARDTAVEGVTRFVVLKCVLPAISSDRAFIELFLDEIRIAARLSHQNIAHVYDVGQDHGQYFIAMEYIDGAHVSQIIRELHPTLMPVEHALKIGSLVAEGLFYAHNLADDSGQALGIIHRDVSPENIMVSLEGQVKLVDFGVARAADQVHQTQVGVLRGKAAYLAPEQCMGKPLDHRVDIFALGTVLHEMLCGRRLFKRENDFKTMQAVCRAPIPLLSEVRPGLPQKVDEIVRKALARDPEQRYQQADELSVDLEHVLQEGHMLSNQILLGRFVRSVLSSAEEMRAKAPLVSSPSPAQSPPAEEPEEEEAADDGSELAFRALSSGFRTADALPGASGLHGERSIEDWPTGEWSGELDRSPERVRRPRRIKVGTGTSPSGDADLKRRLNPVTERIATARIKGNRPSDIPSPGPPDSGRPGSPRRLWGAYRSEGVPAAAGEETRVAEEAARSLREALRKREALAKTPPPPRLPEPPPSEVAQPSTVPARASGEPERGELFVSSGTSGTAPGGWGRLLRPLEEEPPVPLVQSKSPLPMDRRRGLSTPLPPPRPPLEAPLAGPRPSPEIQVPQAESRQLSRGVLESSELDNAVGVEGTELDLEDGSFQSSLAMLSLVSEEPTYIKPIASVLAPEEGEGGEGGNESPVSVEAQVVASPKGLTRPLVSGREEPSRPSLSSARPVSGSSGVRWGLIGVGLAVLMGGSVVAGWYLRYGAFPWEIADRTFIVPPSAEYRPRGGRSGAGPEKQEGRAQDARSQQLQGEAAGGDAVGSKATLVPSGEEDSTVEGLRSSLSLLVEATDQVVLDDQLVGALEAQQGVDLSPGTHGVQVHRPHHLPWIRQIAIQEGEKASVRPEPERAGRGWGEISVTSTPAAEVRLADRLVGRTPLDSLVVRPGAREVTLEFEGGQKQTYRVNVRRNRAVTVRGSPPSVPPRRGAGVTAKRADSGRKSSSPPENTVKTAVAQARRCYESSDPACCIEALRSFSHDVQIATLLVACYDAAGRTAEACELARRHPGCRSCAQFAANRCTE